MKPEEKAREQIDQLLDKAGWKVQDYRELNLGASLGVAACEFPLKSGDGEGGGSGDEEKRKTEMNKSSD